MCTHKQESPLNPHHFQTMRSMTTIYPVIVTVDLTWGDENKTWPVPGDAATISRDLNDPGVG